VISEFLRCFTVFGGTGIKELHQPPLVRLHMPALPTDWITEELPQGKEKEWNNADEVRIWRDLVYTISEALAEMERT
jgi:hypothetical protein